VASTRLVVHISSKYADCDLPGKLEELAEETDRSVSYHVVQAIRLYLSTQDQHLESSSDSALDEIEGTL
jgi:predicted transcriptional regulator